MSALDRIKAIQETDWKTWKGPNVKHSGRPGTAGIIKTRTKKDPNPFEMKDESRFKILIKILLRMQFLDEESLIQPTGNLQLTSSIKHKSSLK